ncbi:unnamed protein product [Diplocarpon coronariae]
MVARCSVDYMKNLKNWSDKPFHKSVASWYWDHARLGPYFLVWISHLPIGGTEKVRSYIVLDNEILAAQCSTNLVIVRPTGPNAQYPPPLSSRTPLSFQVELNIGDGSYLNVTVTIAKVIIKRRVMRDGRKM